MNQDDRFLSRAIELAQRNIETGEGGPFGAVITLEGEIIGEGWNQVVARNDPTAHAEIQAIRAACAAVDTFHLPNSVLYASSEPCPMCMAAIYWARIGRVVFANSRNEAAAIGFCDDELYCELSLPFGERRIAIEHRPISGADTLFHLWAKNPKRILY